MPFGQVVIGPPGSGKTTYCLGMSDFLKASRRDVCIVNLDPANDQLPYECDVDISELVTVSEVQEQLGLGPNGALVYCMEYLEKNLDWLKEQLQPHIAVNKYFLFDCPGQAELYMCHDAQKHVLEEITGEWAFSVTLVQLVDCHLVLNPHKYLSALLLCLTSMLHLSLPHVNVVTKTDLLESMADEDSVGLIERVAEIGYLQRALEAEEQGGGFARRFSRLTEGLCEVIEDYGLVHLYPLAIEQKELVRDVLEVADRANGYFMSGLSGRRQPYEPSAGQGASQPSEAPDLRVARAGIW